MSFRKLYKKGLVCSSCRPGSVQSAPQSENKMDFEKLKDDIESKLTDLRKELGIMFYNKKCRGCNKKDDPMRFQSSSKSISKKKKKKRKFRKKHFTSPRKKLSSEEFQLKTVDKSTQDVGCGNDDLELDMDLTRLKLDD